MQQVATSEPDGGRRPRRHRKTQAPDRVVTYLKIATCAVGAAVIGLIVLMATGWPNDVAGRVPVPPPPAGSPSGDDGDSGEPTAEPSPAMVAPPVRAQTSVAGPTPAPPAPTPAPAPTPNPAPPTPPVPTVPEIPGFTFAVVGQPCAYPGTYSVTSEWEPVACMAVPPTDQPRWHPMF